MPKNLSMDETYEKCVAEGNIILQDKVDIYKIKSMFSILEEYMKLSEELKDKKIFNVQYDTNYNIIHMLAEALLLFDKVKSANHQCLFSVLCVRHPELDLDWNFFEKIRTKRNGIHYYGTSINPSDWKEIELQTKLYIKALHSALKKNIEEHK